MGYEIIVVDDTANKHFKKVEHHLQEKLKEKYSHPHIEKLWRDKIGHHDYLYQAHIKTGEFPHHHHFTVLYEIKGAHEEHVKVIDVQEGHTTLF